MFAARSISPILGFLLGAWCISKYVDLSGECHFDTFENTKKIKILLENKKQTK